MTSPLIDELDMILGRDWEMVSRATGYRRFEGDFVLGYFDPHHPDTPADYLFEEPLYGGAISKLFADLAAGFRSVSIVNKDTLKRVDVPAEFWTIYEWQIHRGPPAAVSERGANWCAYEPKVTAAKPKPQRGRPPAQLGDRGEMLRRLQEEQEKASHKLKRPQAMEILQHGMGATWRQADEVAKEFFAGRRGRPSEK